MREQVSQGPFARKVLSTLSRISVIALLAINGSLHLAGCGNDAPAAPVSLQAQYSSAVNDARGVTPAKIYKGLTPIGKENGGLIWENGVVGSRVLVATVAGGYAAGYKCPDPSGCPGNSCKEGGECAYGYDTWVTVAPELKGFFASTPPSLLRVAQLLGLPPSYAVVGGPREAKYVMEMWVHPEDLFRPCPDSEITDTACDADFPMDRFRVIDQTRKVRATEGLPAPVFKTYTAWFNNRTRNVYTAGAASEAYPWTRLGYTYDWGSGNHVGLSEFVLNGARADGAKISVGIRSVKTIGEYLSR